MASPFFIIEMDGGMEIFTICTISVDTCPSAPSQRRIDMDKTRETEQYLPYATDFILAPGEDLKKLSTKALNHRIKYLRELVIISHKNGYKPPKNIVEELNELIAIRKKGEKK